MGIDQSEEFLEISRERKEEITDKEKAVEYLEKLQRQAIIFADREVFMLGEEENVYGIKELPF